MKNYLKNNCITYLVIRVVLTIYYNYLKNIWSSILAFFRKRGYIRFNKFNRLRELKNKHYGKRCFIIANGPSLTLEDCELLKDEYTFGMNAIVDLFDKTDWRPSYYGVQDKNVYEKILLEKSDMQNIFVADYLSNDSRYILFPLHFLNHRVTYFTKRYWTKFSDNAYACVYDGYSITYSLIQLAYYMGFRKIYLLGCDCLFGNTIENSHFAGCRTFGVESNLSTAAERNLCGYNEAKKFLRKNSGEIVNCTRGGALEIFPRKTLENVLNERDQNNE